MRRTLGTIGVSLLLALGSLAGGGASSAGAQSPTLVVTAPGLLGGPRTDGTTVVWTDRQSGNGADTAIFAANLSNPAVYPVVTGPGSRTVSSIDGGIVVWTETPPGQPAAGGDIRGMDLTAGREFTVAATEADEHSPLIRGSRVIWQQWRGGGVTFMVRDIRTLDPPVMLVRLEGAIGPTTDGARVLWREAVQLPGGARGWRLRVLTFATGQAVTVAEGGGSGPAAEGPSVYTVCNDLVLYGGSAQFAVRGLTLVNLSTGERWPLAAGSVLGVASDGRYVFWAQREETASGQGQGRTNLHSYDSVTSSFFPAATTGADAAAHVSRGIIVWRRDGAAGSEIHATRIVDVLPSTGRAAAGPATPERRYFPETRHSLAFGFKGFWEQSGGLPVFGFPLTEEFEQRNADTGQVHTVQFLERQRFEYHPALVGTAYEVQLGRLGAEEAGQRADLRGLWAFNPVPADAQHPPGCRYVPETRHRLCGEFRSYWERHGLELGDPGVSFRESLALFGYPISEEFVDPATGLVTQYFERSRFEWHPDNPEPYRVLLGRLAADKLAQWGW